ncbi:MAG: ATP-binding protein [Cyanobacteria bacterium REEB446]|nr:ATP-binding protein [Cyanobacteria bacterium REEB446]
MDSDNFKIINVSKDSVTIEILDSAKFDDQFNIGSYIKIPYKNKENYFIIGIINDYKVKNLDAANPDGESLSNHFVINVQLIGSYGKEKEKFIFTRGSHGIPLPPSNGIELLSKDDYENIYGSSIKDSQRFTFSKLLQNGGIPVRCNGNKFFNKHFAIVGSTGSGKSHTVASVLQQAIKEKEEGFEGLNNSHIIIFDIHGEYQKAFPEGNHINSENIKLPYWLFDSDELSDLFIESSESNSHNQVSQFRFAVTQNKKKHNPLQAQEKIYFDSPFKFSIDEVINYIKNINSELINKKNSRIPEDKTGKKFLNRLPEYFNQEYSFDKTNGDFVKGPYTDDFERFILRLEATIKNPRLKFLFENVDNFSLESVLKQFLGYENKKANITVIDLSGIPFEVLSITVSLISRILFEYGYYYKKMLSERELCETPILLVYEEAHKYVPRSDLVKYRASKNAIERIAKEGRKYGVTLGIVSQRPSEISETIFSQCNNFLVMRLTNPDDQNYVKKLLPDTLADFTNQLSSLQAGEALVIGESIVLPSLIKINFPENEPESTDIPYLELWKQKWKDVDFDSVAKKWKL